MTEHVVIAGGGPTGLMLAGELALAGIDVVIVEHLDGARVKPARSRPVEILTRASLDDDYVDPRQR